MTKFPTVETPGRLCGEENPIVSSREGEIDVIWRVNIWVHDNLNLSSKTHDVGEFVFQPKGYGSAL